MKVIFEEYGTFIVSVFLGLICFSLMVFFTIKNGEIMDKVVPDEKATAMKYLDNKEVLNSSKIPEISVESSVVRYYGEKFDPLDPKVLSNITDGEGNKIDVTNPSYVNLIRAIDISNKDKYKDDVLNITGWDQIPNNSKADTKVIYTYTNSKTKYKNEAVCLVSTRIPYKKCEYIESNGTQTLNTNLKPIVGGTRISMVYQPSTVSGTRYVVAASKNSYDKNSFKYALMIKNGIWYVHFEEGKSSSEDISTGISATSGTKHKINFNRNSIEIDGVKFNLSSRLHKIDADAAMNIYLFGNPFSSTAKANGKLYSCKIYEGPHLKRDYMPVYGKRMGTYGLWDKANGKFYMQQTGDEFDGKLENE